MFSITQRLLGGVAATTLAVTSVVGSAPQVSAAHTTQDGQCTDGGGHLFENRVIWSNTFVDAATGVTRVTVDYAGISTLDPAADTLDYSIKTYDASGALIQTLEELNLAWDPDGDYLVRNPMNPSSAPGVSKVVINVGDGNDGFGNCTNTFVQPANGTTSAPPTLQPIAAATVETDAFTNISGYPDGDVADDSAVYENGSNSVIIGGNKANSGAGGIYVADLAGNRSQFIAGEMIGNVDIRKGVTVGGVPNQVVVGANRRDNNTAVYYTLNPTTKQLTRIGSHATGTNYGFCLFQSTSSGNLYSYTTGADGMIRQYELEFPTATSVTGTLVRSFDNGNITEGCVADDANRALYLAEEEFGIERFGAGKADGSTDVDVDLVSGPNLSADVEGLDIVEGATPDEGYLVASSQGGSSYSVYQRGYTASTGHAGTGTDANDFVRDFKVVSSGNVDGASKTDGLSIGQGNLGSAFPQGVLVVHDNNNTGSKTGSSNLKYVPLDKVVSLDFS